MKARINGVTLAYELTGEGEGTPWVLMHAVGMNRNLWDDVVPWLSRHGQVVALDLRGFGESSKPTRPGAAYSIEDHIGDLEGLVGHLGFRRVRLMGLSVGGMIAQRFAHDHPEWVEALILVDTTSDLSDDARRHRLERAERIEREGMAGEVERSIERWFTAPAIERGFPVIDKVREWVRSCDVNGYTANVRMVARWRFTEHLRAIRCPTLIVVGEEDPSMPPAHARLMQDRIAESSLAIIPGASHIPPLEQPEAFRRAVEQFLHHLEK